MKTAFDHEKLDVYQASIRFVCWVDELLHEIPKTLAVHNQLDRASTSIPLNIAEGNGKYTDAAGNEILVRIVSMFVGLIRYTSSHRAHEQSTNYGTCSEESND